MDIHRVAQIIKGTTPAGARTAIRLRQGTVITVNMDGTVDITLGGAETVITSVACFDHVTPVEAAGIWLLSDGVDLIGIGTIGT